MRSFRVRVSAYLLTLSMIPCGHADYQFAPAGPAATATPSTATTTNTTSSSISKTPSSTPAVTETTGSAQPGSGSSINPSASKGKKSQKSGAGANAAVGEALKAAGQALMSNPPTVPMGIVLMMMGMLAMAQSGHDSDAADESAATYNASVIGSGLSPNETTATAAKDAASGKSGFETQEAEAKLKEAGFTFDGKNFTGPDGKVIPATAFNSASGLAAAGLDPGAYSEAQKISAEALKKAGYDGAPSVSGVGVASGGGGGGGASELGGESSEGSLAIASFKNPFSLSEGQRKQIVAGKTVLFDGEPIGARGQNIFDMVHMAYGRKVDGGHFILHEAPPVRAPANDSHIRPGLKSR
ncbi:MAG: hypothetical protein AB7G93_07715 [Bdellovibrionales bacterium]